MANDLSVIDGRNGKSHRITIANDAVQARDFAGIFQSYDHGDDRDGPGLKVVDVGYRNTVAMLSGISDLDTTKGILRFRGVEISELMENYDYEDASFLLIYGYLPDEVEKDRFRATIVANMDPPGQVFDVVQSFERSAPAQAMIIAALAAWNGARPDDVPVHAGTNIYMSPKRRHVDAGIAKTFGAVAAVIAIVNCHKRATNFKAPKPNETLPFNVLHMSSIVMNDGSGLPDPAHVHTLGKLMILYADHGMTNSTAAFLHVASSLTDPITSAISLVTSAYGPLHGGAIEMAYKQFATIERVENVPAFLRRVKAKEERLFGYGHRIWKTTDPRYVFVRRLIETPWVRAAVDGDRLLVIAREVDGAVTSDPYFASRGLKQNIDLAGCFIFKALGFDQDMLLGVAMFARFAGVLAHWREQLRQPVAIWRPQTIYVPTDEANMRAEARDADSSIRNRATIPAKPSTPAKL